MPLHQLLDIERLRLSDCLELLVEGELEVGAHIMRVISEVDVEALIAEDLLFFAKDGVGELGTESRNCLGALLARPHEADGKCLRGVLRP